MSLPHVTATRYVTPLREGGSLPGLVEADDLGLYVAKFTGTGQGRRALVAEVVAAGIAGLLGITVPRLVLLEVDPVIGRREPDAEVQDLLLASPGVNLGVDYLPGSLGLDPLTWPAQASTASEIVWFDCLIENVDRTWRNPNLLLWHRQLQLIDHGASLVFHHGWARSAGAADKAYDVADHVLVQQATRRGVAAAALAPLVTADLLGEVVGLVPDTWLADETGFDGPDAVRAAYVDHFLRRLAARERWTP